MKFGYRGVAGRCRACAAFLILNGRRAAVGLGECGRVTASPLPRVACGLRGPRRRPQPARPAEEHSRRRHRLGSFVFRGHRPQRNLRHVWRRHPEPRRQPLGQDTPWLRGGRGQAPWPAGQSRGRRRLPAAYAGRTSGLAVGSTSQPASDCRTHSTSPPTRMSPRTIQRSITACCCWRCSSSSGRCAGSRTSLWSPDFTTARGCTASSPRVA